MRLQMGFVPVAADQSQNRKLVGACFTLARLALPLIDSALCAVHLGLVVTLTLFLHHELLLRCCLAAPPGSASWPGLLKAPPESAS